MVKDKRGRPVGNADITAYAFTSKFGSPPPGITIFGKTVKGKWFRHMFYDAAQTGPRNALAPMDWSLWRQRMGLDSIEYYKFLYPETYYLYSEKMPQGEATQIAPYVVIDGEVQGIHILWIDEQPHYFHQAGQLNIHSFPITSGTHTLKFRTHDREIVAEGVHVAEGTKTIVSVNGKRSADGITVTEFDKKTKGVLSDREMAILTDYMITVDNNFGTVNLPDDRETIDIPAMIETGGVYYYLNHTVKQWYDRRSGSLITAPVLAGPFPYRAFSSGGPNIGRVYADTVLLNTFRIDGGYHYTIRNNYGKQQKWGRSPIARTLSPFTPDVSFSQNALTATKIRAVFLGRLAEEMEQRTIVGCGWKLAISRIKKRPPSP